MSNRSYRNRSGMPLGGIGAGKVEFCPNGKFTNCTASNNWDAPIIGGGASASGDTPDGPGIRGAFLARFVEGAGAQVLRAHGWGRLPGLREEDMAFEALFPRASVAYPPLGGVSLSLEAFSALCLDEARETRYRSSSLPGAVFRFMLRNESEQVRRAAVAVSWENLVGMGGYAGVVVNHTDCRACEPIRGEDLVGVRFYASRRQLNGRTVGEYALLCPRRPGVSASACAGWDLDAEDADDERVWGSFARTGELPSEDPAVQAGDAGHQFARLDGGAVAQSVELAPGEERTLEFVLSWYFPHLLSPGFPPVDYGHAYQNWFGSAVEVGRYLLAEADTLRARTVSWQRALEGSNLPRWVVRKLCNDLAVLYSNSWYTRDYRFTLNESPTYMRGCLGTLDQRMASGGVFAMCFPGLAAAELGEWAAQQISEDDPLRYGPHWDCRTGRPDAVLDRAGAVRHDLGWDHLEGGDYGTPAWSLLHWPDLAPAFVLQCYNLAVWTGDDAFLQRMYPSLKRAMLFVARLDQDGDGVPDLWGPGSCSYDNEHFPYYGASSYIASLYLAGLRVAGLIASRHGDEEFSSQCFSAAERVRRVLEGDLWDPARGYFISWRDGAASRWAGRRAHAERSEDCIVAQVAGEWPTAMFGLEPGVDRGRLTAALRRIYELNVRTVAGCAANEASPDGSRSFSWPFYVETYFSCAAAYHGLPDEALDAFRRIDFAVSDCAQSPWDAPLVWEGKDNTCPGWGRWYMSNPASWFFLHALAGMAYNAFEGVMRLDPHVPADIGGGRELVDLPIFLPQAWLSLSARFTQRARDIRLTLTRAIEAGGVRLSTVILRLPEGARRGALSVTDADGRAWTWSHVPRSDGNLDEIRIEVEPGAGLRRPGDGLCIRVTW